MLYWLSILLAFIWGCSKDSPSSPARVTHAYTIDYSGFSKPQIPLDNKLTKEGVALGRLLFYDKKLSEDFSMNCASCHDQKHVFSDTDRFSVGVAGKKGSRQAMGIFNMLWNENDFFWDGRAHLLRNQALMPIEDPLEMNVSLTTVVERLAQEEIYRHRFKAAFGSENITKESISLALEQFMNTLISNQSKYDQVIAGNQQFTVAEARGRRLFFAGFNGQNPGLSGAGCANCHGGTNFENNGYMNNGLNSDDNLVDIGRMKVTKLPLDKASFKVPSLRNIAVSFPYMHDGRFNTLAEVVDHYNNGVAFSANLNHTLASVQKAGGLGLSEQDKKDLIAFLETLTDTSFLNNPAFSDPF